MKNWAPLQPCLVSTILTLIAVTTGCGGGVNPNPPRAYIQATAHPLVAQYSVASPCGGQAMVEFGPDTSYGRDTAWYPVSPMFSSSQTLQVTNILVAGMRASTPYHMRAQVQCSDNTLYATADLIFTTGPLPSIPFPTLSVTRPVVSTISPENPGVESLDVLSAGTPALFTDRDANPIWYYDVGQGNYPFPFKPLPNGHVILAITGPSGYSLLREVDLAGNTIREMTASALDVKMQAAGFDFIPYIFHHEILPLANGHLMVLTNFSQNYTNLPGYPGTMAVTGDGIVDLDQNWNPVWAWNAFDHTDVIPLTRHLNGLPDWTHSNALAYSPSDGNLLLSMRHQSWVLKINYNNGVGAGNILWKLGYEGDFALTQSGIPTQDPSDWFSFQHFPSIVSQNGAQTSLAVWDNGDNRVLDGDGDLCGSSSSEPPCYSRATTFQIDESAMVADLTWFDQVPSFGIWGGSINQLGNGNVEFDLNAPAIPPAPNVASQIQEVTQTSNPQVVWQMQISPSNDTAYRAYRIPSLYPGVTWQY